MKKIRVFYISFLFISFLFAISSNVYGYGELGVKINNAFKAAGITGGRAHEVEYGLPYKIYLRGNYISEAQFDKAFKLAQAIAGPLNVYPGYNVIHANIMVTNLEECAAAGIIGKPLMCPSSMPVIPGTNRLSKIKKYALIIAVGEFKYLHPNLGKAPLNDAKLVKNVLQKEGFRTVELENSQATYKNVHYEIKNMLKKMPNGSTFVIYASSHGTPPSHNGNSGIVLYNTNPNKFDLFSKSKGSYILSSANYDSASTRSINIGGVNATTKADEWYSIDRTALTYFGKNGISTMVEASGKDIRLIVIPDVCYSGGEFKNKHYSTSIDAAKRVTESLNHVAIFIGPANGKQESMQTRIGKPVKVSHGIFTYYYFHYLNKDEDKAFLDYKNEKNNIQKTSAKTCVSSRALSIAKHKTPDDCNTSGQTPFFKSNNMASAENYKF